MVEERYVEVALKLPVDRAFRYRVPPALAAQVSPGVRLRVPFRNRTATGICVGFTPRPDLRGVRDVLDVLDEAPVLPGVLLELARWIARRYLCSLGEALAAILPPPVRGRRAPRKILHVLPAAPRDALDEASARLDDRRPAQARVLEYLRDHPGGCEASFLRRRLRCSDSPLRSLERAGLVRIERRPPRGAGTPPTHTPAPDSAGGGAAAAPVLHADQVAALEPILGAIRRGGFGVFLLHGVTGSGKTEVYLRAIDSVLRRGGQAIVLVPEISLTPQTVSRFRARLPRIAVLHSRLGDAERHGEWRRIRDGRARVVIGARSALFAPTPNLGILVLDEEHEGSFKQHSTPRYHARDTALERARLQGIPVILGSATPSLESFERAVRGEYTLLRLPRRVDDRPLPRVEIVDMNREGRSGRHPPLLAHRLRICMDAALARGEQVLLYLNRRGHSTFVRCPRCGHVLRCRRCDISLTYHRGRDRVLCHYCSSETPPPRDCPACATRGIRYLGAGTEKIEEEVRRLYPQHPAARLDSDTARERGWIESVLERFRKGEIRILIGTQMIGKGLDYPEVTVVGIVSPDVSLHLPDFRAAERTFQQVAQVAGRTGRGSKEGVVIVQTSNPEHPAIRFSSKHDFEGFARHEIPSRRALGYPPFGRLLRILLSGRDETSVRRLAGEVAAALRPAFPEGRILGPCPAPIAFIEGRLRYHILIKGDEEGGCFDEVPRHIGTLTERCRDVSVALDVDPSDTL